MSTTIDETQKSDNKTVTGLIHRKLLLALQNATHPELQQLWKQLKTLLTKLPIENLNLDDDDDNSVQRLRAATDTMMTRLKDFINDTVHACTNGWLHGTKLVQMVVLKQWQLGSLIYPVATTTETTTLHRKLAEAAASASSCTTEALSTNRPRPSESSDDDDMKKDETNSSSLKNARNIPQPSTTSSDVFSTSRSTSATKRNNNKQKHQQHSAGEDSATFEHDPNCSSKMYQNQGCDCKLSNNNNNNDNKKDSAVNVTSTSANKKNNNNNNSTSIAAYKPIRKDYILEDQNKQLEMKLSAISTVQGKEDKHKTINIASDTVFSSSKGGLTNAQEIQNAMKLCSLNSSCMNKSLTVPITFADEAAKYRNVVIKSIHDNNVCVGDTSGLTHILYEFGTMYVTNLKLHLCNTRFYLARVFFLWLKTYKGDDKEKKSQGKRTAKKIVMWMLNELYFQFINNNNNNNDSVSTTSKKEFFKPNEQQKVLVKKCFAYFKIDYILPFKFDHVRDEDVNKILDLSCRLHHFATIRNSQIDKQISSLDNQDRKPSYEKDRRSLLDSKFKLWNITPQKNGNYLNHITLNNSSMREFFKVFFERWSKECTWKINTNETPAIAKLTDSIQRVGCKYSETNEKRAILKKDKTEEEIKEEFKKGRDGHSKNLNEREKKMKEQKENFGFIEQRQTDFCWKFFDLSIIENINKKDWKLENNKSSKKIKSLTTDGCSVSIRLQDEETTNNKNTNNNKNSSAAAATASPKNQNQNQNQNQDSS